MSQYTGDLSNAGNFSFYKEAYQRFCRLFRFSPRVVVSDLHPDYMSTRFAEDLAREDPALLHLRVQHHHAHIASSMLEAGLDGEVIGFSFDGTGLGTDGHGWGGEVMRAGFHGFERLYHFEYMPLPGGDAAVTEPWRMGISYLYSHYGSRAARLRIPLVDAVGRASIDQVTTLINKGIHAPTVSSAGRLFDAVAAITGLILNAGYSAQAPMLLESSIDPGEKGIYPVAIQGQQISFLPMIGQIVEDLNRKRTIGCISARFHNTLAAVIVQLSCRIRTETGLDRVVLAGGTFQNRYLVTHVKKQLAEHRFDVYLPSVIPVNDQGIAAGQAVVGAHMWEQLKEAGHA
jgi:hydrogenase maturation protein HypF